jgi:hypothetical protein
MPSPVLSTYITITSLAVAAITAAYLAATAIAINAFASSSLLFISNNTQNIVHKLNVISSIYSLTFWVL